MTANTAARLSDIVSGKDSPKNGVMYASLKIHKAFVKISGIRSASISIALNATAEFTKVNTKYALLLL